MFLPSHIYAIKNIHADLDSLLLSQPFPSALCVLWQGKGKNIFNLCFFKESSSCAHTVIFFLCLIPSPVTFWCDGQCGKGLELSKIYKIHVRICPLSAWMKGRAETRMSYLRKSKDAQKGESYQIPPDMRYFRQNSQSPNSRKIKPH